VAAADREMTPFDTVLFRGDADPHTRALLSVAYVLDRAPTREQFVATFDRASRMILRMRQKVVAPPVPLFLPSWIVDPDFDLGYHLRFGRLPAPGGLRELMEAAQAEVVTPLEPDRPLWEAVLLEGFRGSKAAAIIRMSHAVTDGIGAVKLFAALIDTERTPDKGEMPPEPIPEDVTPEELLERSLRRLPASALHVATTRWRDVAGTVLRAAGAPRSTAAAVLDYFGSLRRVMAAQGEPSPLLAGRSLARRCLGFEMPLADFKRAGKAIGATVNDLYLAGLVTALRRYHAAMGERVASVPIAIPVNLRSEDAPAEGNYFGAILMAGPVGEPDALERVRLIAEAVRTGRAEPAIGAIGVLAPVLARLPEGLRRSIAEATPKPDVQASNVPGPTVPIYLAGARIEKSYAFGPAPGSGAMFTMQSLAGTCFVGANIDPAAFTDVPLLGRCLQQGFAETLKLGVGRPRVGKPVVGRGLEAELQA
jgi:diacylglycerol O-acyltransferase